MKTPIRSNFIHLLPFSCSLYERIRIFFSLFPSLNRLHYGEENKLPSNNDMTPLMPVPFGIITVTTHILRRFRNNDLVFLKLAN